MPNDAPAARPEDRTRGLVAKPGMVLGGKYRLEEAIARGGMARVWRARHIELSRPVAVKFVDAAGAGPSGIERFLIEAKVAASVRHKNVVDIVDFGFVEQPDHDPEPYMVMELLEGETLGDRIERSPLSDDETVDITLQLLSGLDAVHRAGIIHRDLKPGNVFLTHDHDGTFARLLDFGISEGAEQRAFGDSGLVVGTPEYMSPEQAFGAAIDLRADLYGVGVLLYEMLSAGRLPFEHDEGQRVLEMVVAGVHTPLVKLRPDQPDLAAVVERALARNPEDRYKNARDMRRAIVEATGSGDNTTERMAAIRESGTRRRLETATASELAAPSLPAGSPLRLVALPPAPPTRRPIMPIAVGVVLAAVAGVVWAMTPSSGAPTATPAATTTTREVAVDDVVDEAAREEVTAEEAPVASAPSAADEAAPDEVLADAPSEPTDEPLLDSASAPSTAEEAGAGDGSEGGATRRRPGRRITGGATDADEIAPTVAPVEPPRAVVRDLDF